MSNQTGYLSVNVTSHVQEWADGSRSNYGFHLSTDGTTGENHTFASRESATSSYRPRLEIVYSPVTTDNAEIVWFNPPTGTLQRGNQASATVRVKNTGSSTRSFWVGLSFAEPDAGEWPDGWYDIPPIETNILGPGAEQTITFNFDILWWLTPGNYTAVTAVWEGYDSQNNLMVEPRFDDSTATSFTLGTYALSDVESYRILAPETVPSLATPREFIQLLDGFRSWIGTENIEGSRIIVEKLTADGAQSQRLKITVDRSASEKIDYYFGKNSSQIFLVLPNNADLSNVVTHIDGVNEIQWGGLTALKFKFLVTGPAGSVKDFIVGKVVDVSIESGFIWATNFTHVPLSYETLPSSEFTVLAIDFDEDKWGRDYIEFNTFDIAFDVSFTDGNPSDIGVVADLRYKLKRLSCPRTVFGSAWGTGVDDSLIGHQEYRQSITIEKEALGITPIPPTGIDAQTGSGSGEIILSWNSSSGATGYKIYYDEDSSNPPFSPSDDGNPASGSDVGNVTQVTISDLTPGGSYYCAVVAYNSAGDSDYSSQDSATAGVPCTYSISPTSKNFSSSSASGSVSVTTQGACSWTAVSNKSWITITSGSSGSGNGTVNYSVSSNSSTGSLTGTMTIAGETFTVTQSGVSCTYSISPTSQSFSSSGGTGSVNVTASSSECGWSATSNDGWITITSGSSGSGNGTVNYSVSSNSSISSRTGTMTIAGETFTATQDGDIDNCYVNKDDFTCGGNSPCYSNIQEAIDAAGPVSTIKVVQGFYDEDVTLKQ
jgi:hypothetical protein